MFEIHRDLPRLDVYKKVISHRNHYTHWINGEFCLSCFGGGLTKFTQNLIKELKDKKIKLENMCEE